MSRVPRESELVQLRGGRELRLHGAVARLYRPAPSSSRRHALRREETEACSAGTAGESGGCVGLGPDDDGAHLVLPASRALAHLPRTRLRSWHPDTPAAARNGRRQSPAAARRPAPGPLVRPPSSSRRRFPRPPSRIPCISTPPALPVYICHKGALERTPSLERPPSGDERRDQRPAPGRRRRRRTRRRRRVARRLDGAVPSRHGWAERRDARPSSRHPRHPRGPRLEPEPDRVVRPRQPLVARQRRVPPQLGVVAAVDQLAHRDRAPRLLPAQGPLPRPARPVRGGAPAPRAQVRPRPARPSQGHRPHLRPRQGLLPHPERRHQPVRLALPPSLASSPSSAHADVASTDSQHVRRPPGPWRRARVGRRGARLRRPASTAHDGARLLHARHAALVQ